MRWQRWFNFFLVRYKHRLSQLVNIAADDILAKNEYACALNAVLHDKNTMITIPQIHKSIGEYV